MRHLSTTPLIYALKNGQLVGIDEVPNGSRCGCACPHCGEMLVARNGGKKMQHHFAHPSDSTCVGAAETALHLMAKDVLRESRQLMLPDYDDYKGRAMTFDEIVLEERQAESGLQPDCIGIKDGHRLWIEIKVNHAVEDSKLEYIRMNQIGCVEMDFSVFLNKEYSRENLRQFLSCDSDFREWLYIKGHYEKREAQRKVAEEAERSYIEQRLSANPTERLVSCEQCSFCPFHTTRISIAKLLRNHFSVYWKLIPEIQKLPLKALRRPLVYRGEYPKAYVECGGFFYILYNIYKEESNGSRLYYFFRTVLPTEATRLGEVCRCCVYQTSDGKIICNCPHQPHA